MLFTPENERDGLLSGVAPDSYYYLVGAPDLTNPNPAPKNPALGPVPPSSPPGLQSRSSPETTIQNDMWSTQLSMSHQALAPLTNPLIANTVASPGAGESSGGVPGNLLTTPAPTAITVAGLSMQSASNGGVVLAGQTLAPGLQTTIGGHAISVGSGNVVVDGNTQILPTAIPAPSPQPLIGGSTMQRASNGAVIVGSSTLPLNAQATIAGHVISVGTANVVIDGTTNALPTPAPTDSPILLNGQTIQRASNGGLVIGTSTLAPGTQTTIAGHVISAGNNNVVLDSSTYTLPPVAGATLVSSPNASPQRNAITLPNGSILSAGGTPVTISGAIVSVLSNDQGAVIDGSTMLFASPTAQSVFTVGGQTFTASPSSFVVGGATVSLDGDPVTIAGTVVSLGPSGLQIGSMTVPLASATLTGLGGYIVSAFEAPTATANGTGSVGGGTGVEAYTGSGASLKGDVWMMCATVVMCMGIGMVAVLM